MADYDPKDVPILDDVIESADHEKKDPVLNVGSAEPPDTESDAGFSATENGLDLFASKTIDLATDDAAENIESALVDYNAIDKVGTPTLDVPAIDRPVTDKQPLKVKQQSSTANSLLSITDDIVKQLMPKLELHLRLLLRQALKENLPEEITRSKTSSPSNTDS